MSRWRIILIVLILGVQKFPNKMIFKIKEFGYEVKFNCKFQCIILLQNLAKYGRQRLKNTVKLNKAVSNLNKLYKMDHFVTRVRLFSYIQGHFMFFIICKTFKKLRIYRNISCSQGISFKIN
jgi:hypothetical protein